MLVHALGPLFIWERSILGIVHDAVVIANQKQLSSCEIRIAIKSSPFPPEVQCACCAAQRNSGVGVPHGTGREEDLWESEKATWACKLSVWNSHLNFKRRFRENGQLHFAKSISVISHWNACACIGATLYLRAVYPRYCAWCCRHRKPKTTVELWNSNCN